MPDERPTGENESFQITLGDFSGPLDLLCHLVESRAMDASAVKLTDVLSQYVTYLVTTKRATLMELAEFFSLASRLLLRKVRALLPRLDAEDEPEEGLGDEIDEDALGDNDLDEETLLAMLERFRPYRAAAMLLMERKAERERSFVRDAGEGGPPWFDIGDLHGLATHWWGLIDDYSRHRAARTASGFMMEVPDAVPEEILVEARMAEIRDLLSDCRTATLRSLLARFGPDGLIVTLLALLELSRLGQLDMVQSEAWGDVEIAAA